MQVFQRHEGDDTKLPIPYTATIQSSELKIDM